MLEDSEEVYIRGLLDQRSKAVLAHSPEQPDSPSVYSVFTPRLADPQSPVHSPNHALTDLALSMLEQDEDQLPWSRHGSGRNDSPDSFDADDDDDHPLPRMSLLGPKMRFHSKAPWEIDDGIEEEDEPEPRSSGSSRFKDASVRALGFQATKQGFLGRSSGESQILPKRSFETTSSQISYPHSSLDVVSQKASMSATSLVSSSFQQPRSMFAIGRVRSHSPSPGSASQFSASGSPYQNNHFSMASPYHPNNELHATNLRPHRFPAQSPDDEPHPYANSANILPPSTPSTREATPSVGGLDQPDTAPSTLTSGMRHEREFSSSGSIRTLQGREISSPMPVRDGSGGDGTFPFTGWTDRGQSPPFNLITLAEAQAQRSRSQTVQMPSPSKTLASLNTTNVPFPEEKRQSGHSPTSSVASRARARSISAGARAKQAFTSIVSGNQSKSERRDIEAPPLPPNTGGTTGKTVKHKKSGLLRLFNGPKEEKATLPPMPVLADKYVALNSANPNMQRVPVPQVFLPLDVGEGSTPSSVDTARLSPMTKRVPPPLTISPIHANSIPRAPASAIDESFPSRREDHVPQSAPPNITDFPSLRLRPVSTLFSAHFGEHIVSGTAQSPGADLDSPSTTSPTTLLSPATPGVYTKSDRINEDSSRPASGADDQAAVIRALQEQILSTKKAWQRHIWELEGQIRDLKAEVQDLRTAAAAADNIPYCETCGRGENVAEKKVDSDKTTDNPKPSVINRPRARTGTLNSARFGAAV